MVYQADRKTFFLDVAIRCSFPQNSVNAITINHPEAEIDMSYQSKPRIGDYPHRRARTARVVDLNDRDEQRVRTENGSCIGNRDFFTTTSSRIRVR